MMKEISNKEEDQAQVVQIEPRGIQLEALYEIEKAREEGIEKGLLVSATGDRVIIVTGCINALVSRVSETFIKNNSCIV